MEFVVHNRRNMTLRAAFIVAFFASFFTSFFSHADFITDTGIKTSSPMMKFVYEYTCSNSSGQLLGMVSTQSEDPLSAHSSCAPLVMQELLSRADDYALGNWCYDGVTSSNVVPVGVGYTAEITYLKNAWNNVCFTVTQQSSTLVGGGARVESLECPSVSYPNHVSSGDLDGNGEIDYCYDPAEFRAFQEGKNILERADEECRALVLDSGNNTAPNTCYTSPFGSSCQMERVSSSGSSSDTYTNYNYYKGVKSEVGCDTSTDPIHDQAGLGNVSDDCIVSEGVTLCKANTDKHTTTVDGVNILDEGCFSIGGDTYCDPSKHPDVGEGDSDYFDENGSCSIVAGSTYKGACEELGGIWDKSGDYNETRCPSSPMGHCSIPSSGGCHTCLDNGGTWTPKPAAPMDSVDIGLDNVAALTQKNNDALKTLELTNRKGNEVLVSTIKSTNDKILGELKVLSGKGSGGVGAVVAKLDELKEEEKESYTTNASKPNKSKINGLFDANSTTALKAEIEVLKTELTTQFNTIRAEGASLFSIQVPSSSGYQSRSLNLTYGSVDMSLSRFSQYFALLAGPIMFIASVIAGFILLGSRK